MRMLPPVGLGLIVLSLAAQQQFVFTDPTKNIEVSGGSGIVRVEGGPTYRFDIRNGVHATIHDQGLEFFAPRIQGVTSRANSLSAATASGGVRVVKTSAGSQTVITGSTARYTSQGTAGKLDLAGPVLLTDFQSAKRQTLTAKGSSAVAVTTASKDNSLPLRTATLRGPVVIDSASRISGKLETVHASGSKLDIDNTAKPAKLILSGGVVIDGKQFGHMSGVSRLTMFVNARGEITAIETIAGSGR